MWDGHGEIDGPAQTVAPPRQHLARRPSTDDIQSHNAADVHGLIAASVSKAGYRPDRLTAEAHQAIVLYGGGDAQSISRLCRAALYVAQIDGALRVTSEHVTKIVRIRDGDTALALEQPVPAVRQYVVQSDAGTWKSAVGAGGMLLGAGAVIGLGVWLASAPDPGSPSGSSFRNEPVTAASTRPPPVPRDAISDHAGSDSTSQTPSAPVPDIVTVAATPAVLGAPPGTTPGSTLAVGVFEPQPEPSANVSSVSPEATFANLVPAPEAVAPKSLAAEADIALPTGAPARVFLRYADGDAGAAAAAERLKASLRAARVEVAAMSAEPKRLLRSGVTYYFAEDRPAAEDVAARLEAGLLNPVRLAATGPSDSLHAPGTIEVAVPVARTAASR